MSKIEGPFLCLRSACGTHYRIVEGETYTEDDFRPGGLLDALRAGFIVPVNAPPKPKPKRKKVARPGNNSSSGTSRKRRGSRSTRKD